MSGRRVWSVMLIAALLHAFAILAPAALPTVTVVELSSTHPLPEERVRAAIGDLAGKSLSRDAVRASLERLWGLGLFSAIRVDEIPDPGGVRLRYQFTERLLIRKISWWGRAGLDLAEVAATANLAVGDEASPSRLAQAERDLLARYRREGYLGASVDIQTEAVPDSSERDVTVTLRAGDQARVGVIRFQGDTGLPASQLEKSLKLREGRAYKESLLREDARAAEERLRQEGYYEARVTAGLPDWQAATNRVDLDF